MRRWREITLNHWTSRTRSEPCRAEAGSGLRTQRQSVRSLSALPVRAMVVPRIRKGMHVETGMSTRGRPRIKLDCRLLLILTSHSAKWPITFAHAWWGVTFSKPGAYILRSSQPLDEDASTQGGSIVQYSLQTMRKAIAAGLMSAIAGRGHAPTASPDDDPPYRQRVARLAEGRTLSPES